MNAPMIARILGLVFLIVGIAALIPLAFISPPAPFDAPVVTIGIAYRMLFGIFPVNAALDAVNIFLGAFGLLAAMHFDAAAWYCKIVSVLSLILVIFGAIPLTNTLIGVAPIYGWDIALYALVALLAAYGGYGRGSFQLEEEPQAASGS